MSSGLITFFQTHRNDDQQRGSLRVGTIAEVLEFVADVLLEEKITDYLVGVESHPQLITRGYNAVGFLAVTNKFNTEQADVVWKSIVTSQDPRVVGATLFLLEQLTKQLTKFDEDVYFCKKLLDSPLPIMSREACSFYTNFLDVLRLEYRELPAEYHLKEENYESSLLPLKLCIRLMRELSPTSAQGLAATGIFGDALNTLSHLANLTSSDVRKSLYAMCIQSLQAQSEDAPADIQAMLGMTKDCHDDLKYLALELKVLPILMDEFCSFVSRTKSSTQVLESGRLFQALTPRLDLILRIVMLDPQTVNEDRTKVFWNHLVGSEAINFVARDVAWRLLATFVPGSGADNPFLDRCYEDFLSTTELKPDFFTQNFFHFVLNITKYKIVRGQLVIPQDGDVVEIPGIDLLWRAILTAARNAGEETAMDFLATIYLDPSWPKTISPASLEATHAALVDDCLNRLKSAHSELRSLADVPARGEPDEVVHQKASQAELTFLRTLNVLSRVLITIRKLPAFRSASAQAAQPTSEIPTVIRGPPVTIRCQFFKVGTGNSAVRDIHIGELDTCLQLHRRIARIASEFDMASYKIIWQGRMFNLLVKPRELLKDMNITTIANFIVREAPGLNDLQAARVTPSKQCRTAFEQHIISNFHDFYALMDSDDASSAAIFEFFSNFPKYEKIKSLVQNDSVPLVEVFPPGQLYKIQYSFQCLTEVLQDKTEDGTLGDEFVSQGIHLIESFLTAGEDSYQVPPRDLVLASVAIAGLFDFLTNREGADTSPFSNPKLLVKRVYMIMWSSLNYHDWMHLVLSCYEFLLTASRICPSAWQVFSQADGESEKDFKIVLNTVHYRLLLGQKPLAPAVRIAIRNLIKVYLERFVPPAHLTKHALVNFFWAKISALLLQTPTQPLQSAEVFELAEILLENHTEDLALSSQALTQYFSEWSILLAKHKHEEIVGQDNIDQIIRGFSSILRLCALALPLSETESSSQELVRQIWHKFLFPRKSIPFAEQSTTTQLLPVLESSTRQSMLRLIMTLINGSDPLLEDFLNLAAEPRLDERFRRGWSVDRSSILRAPSGFVGLKNLGNTCYMNSLLTQLFMNPGFRAFLLRCRTSTAASTARLLLETQNLFAHMQNSYAKAADAGEFTCNIKTLTEDPIDVREQMDVDEFMNTLFMRWEEQMLSNESKEEFRSFYTGKTVQQIKSKECDHVSERDDTCLAIQCDVQGKATLEESLQAFIEGDVMQGGE
jgi:ubiquitin carboxyl-terminal hydrolase 34